MSMLTDNDAIHGWSPASDGDVEVNIAQDMCLLTINAITPSSSFLSPVCPPLNTPLAVTDSNLCPPLPSSPVSPSMGIPRTTIAPSSDRRAQRNRNRDPSWVPRPRNAFIIFRCEYSREHAQNPSQERQSDPDPTGVTKTLSKRAAEAWRQLPSPEKERYKAMADREREEHARLHPHYRFRPVKRQGSRTRKNSHERSPSPKASSGESHPPPSVHPPSVLASASKMPRSGAPVERTEGSDLMPQLAGLTLADPSAYSIEQAKMEPEVSFGMDYDDALLFYPPFRATLSPDSSPSAELYSPREAPTVNTPAGAFRCHDPAFSLDSGREDLEQAQALEAYAIGLHNHDLFSPFSFPEYY